MANFKKGQSMKKQRVVAVQNFDQKGKNMDGQNVAFSIANDQSAIEDVQTAPMLVYGSYEDANGEKQASYTDNYSKTQWDKFVEKANKDGDKYVADVDVFPNKDGSGLVINTNTLETPEAPFDAEAHRANTLEAREVKAAAREAAAAEKSTEAPDKEQDQGLEA